MPNMSFTCGLALASALIVIPQELSTVQRHTVELADDKYEGRGAGYPGERRAADYIAAQFKQIGLAPAGDAGGYFQPFRFHVMHPVNPWEILQSRNVIGRLDGTDTAVKGEVVVIGAHYDGQGKAGQADPFRVPSPDSAADQIWNSANDNAASVAALLEIARAMKQGATPPKRSVLFVAFGAEEHGMTGSLHYVAHPAAPIRDHVAMINLEKLGRVSDTFNISGNATSSVWTELVKTITPQTGVQVVPTNPFAVPESDHYPFAASGVPAIMFYVTGAPDSHQPSDSAERIDFNRVAQAARTVLQMSLDLASRPQRPSFTPAPFPDVGLSVHLATAAEADAREVPAPHGGLKVTGVIAGLPADKAGLQPGDFIVEMANQQFRRDETLAALMAMHREVLEGKRGYTLPVKVVRGKTRLDLVMKLR